MKRNATIICLGLVVMLCDSCGQSQQEGALNACLLESPFVAKQVVDLPDGSGFDPIDYGNCTTTGADCDNPPPTNNPAPSSYGSAIEQAIKIAPCKFQSEIATFSYIYIDHETKPKPNKPDVWGLRETLHDNRKHIGISEKVLQALFASGTPYALYETGVLRTLLTKKTPPSPLPLPAPAVDWLNGTPNDPSKPGISYEKAVPDSQAIAILAILAHEMGHVIWWEQNVGTKQCDVSGVNPYFYSYSGWNKPTIPRFHEFGIEDTKNGDVRPDKDKVRSYLVSGAAYFPFAVNALQQIYSGPWASLFATVAPDEDFIETYMLYILTANPGPNLTSVQIVIPSLQPFDIFANLNNSSILSGKRKWISSCLQGPLMRYQR
jgi:hypothetical protein